jgi:hypothetical protein
MRGLPELKDRADDIFEDERLIQREDPEAAKPKTSEDPSVPGNGLSPFSPPGSALSTGGSAGAAEGSGSFDLTEVYGYPSAIKVSRLAIARSADDIVFLTSSKQDSKSYESPLFAARSCPPRHKRSPTASKVARAGCGLRTSGAPEFNIFAGFAEKGNGVAETGAAVLSGKTSAPEAPLHPNMSAVSRTKANMSIRFIKDAPVFFWRG